MRKNKFSSSKAFVVLCAFLILLAAPGKLLGAPSTAAIFAFNSYANTVESRIAQQHRSASSFLGGSSPSSAMEARLKQGELIIEKLSPPGNGNQQGAMMHHWRGTAFVPGAKATDFEHLMKSFANYPQYYAPQVVQSKTLMQNGDQFQVLLRVRQKHVITVVMDTTYDVNFGRLDAQHGYSVSRSTRISEIDSPGTHSEHALSPSEEHGFLWRLNTYWSYEERDGGLYMQIESISLTRSIPRGLGWAIGPFVESVPRESLEFTLRSTCNALKKAA